MTATINGHLPNNMEDATEDRPMLIVKKSGDSQGITALFNRQLQGWYHSSLSEINQPLLEGYVKLYVEPLLR